MKINAEVLIVGAGPTGLTLACLLAQRGIDFRIIEASAATQIGSRGKGLQPRSLELFDDLGVVEAVLSNGRLGMPICAYDNANNPTIRSSPATDPARPEVPYLATLITPEWRIEEALRENLRAHGDKVDFGTELTAFVQDDAGVTAHVSTASGSTTFRARWLVGADGGKSLVRHIAQIEFLGETLETHRMLVGDVRIDGLDRDHWHMWRGDEGILMLCPLPSTDQFQFQASIMPDQNAAVTLENFQELVQRRSRRSDIILSDPGWMSLWRANIRMVDRYRDRRVFLAGDAAHVHSPAGGQGMNTGIQDAYNLGWKLAAVIGGTDSTLLDTYQEERLPVAASVLALSTRLMESIATTREMTIARNDQTMQIGIGYRDGRLAKDLRASPSGVQAGDRAPDAPGLSGPNGSRRMFDLLRGPHATILGFGKRWQPVVDACTARFGTGVKAYIIVGAADDARHVWDVEAHARRVYADETLFVIRPDNYVGLVTDREDEEAVADYLKAIVPAALAE